MDGVKFSELHKYSATKLVVSPRHEAWLAVNSNPRYSAEALDFGRSQLLSIGLPRDRRGTVSASSFGSCHRKQQFTYLGLPELPPSSKLAQVFQNGSFMHVRWQMAGLTEGWLTRAEVPVGRNDFWLSGTQDGIAYDGSVVEFKSVNTIGFTKVASFGPQPGHKIQIATYVLTTGAQQASLIYEDKNTQEYKEFVFKDDELPLQEVADQAVEMWQRIEAEVLYEPLTECEAGVGYRFLGCPFRKQCLKIRNWKEAKELADQAA